MDAKIPFWKSNFRMPMFTVGLIVLLLAGFGMAYEQLVIGQWKQTTVTDLRTGQAPCLRGGGIDYYYSYEVDGKTYSSDRGCGPAMVKGDIVSYDPLNPANAVTATFGYQVLLIALAAILGVIFMLIAIFGPDLRKPSPPKAG